MNKRICIVAGHGQGDSGAVNSSLCLHESILVRQMAIKLKEYLPYAYLYPISQNLFVTRDYKNHFTKNDFVIELHLNGFHLNSANGTEIFILPEQKECSIVRGLHNINKAYFRDRGIKTTRFTNMSELAKLGIDSCLVETCFITSDSDMNIYSKHLDEIVKGMVMVLEDNTPRIDKFKSEFVDYRVRVSIDNLRIRKEPNLNGHIIGFIPQGVYTIVQESFYDGHTWGRLKSGIGWIALTHTSRVK